MDALRAIASVLCCRRPPPAHRSRPPPTTPSSPPPAAPPPPLPEACEQRLKLTDIIGLVARNGYAREASRCAGLNRETWRCVPAGLSPADAARVRAGHPLWRAIIDLTYNCPMLSTKMTRLGLAAYLGNCALVRDLLDWHADANARLGRGATALTYATAQPDCLRELIDRGADLHAADSFNYTALHEACMNGHSKAIRMLLAAGADADMPESLGRTARQCAFMSSFEFGDGIDEVRSLFPAPGRAQQ